MTKHPFHWKYNPYLELWEKGKLRVSAGLVAQIDDRTLVRHKNIASIKALSRNIQRKRRTSPPPVLTGAARRRILRRINAAGSLRLGGR